MTLNSYTRDSLERNFPRVNFCPDARSGEDECPNCHGRGSTWEEARTLSPSDADWEHCKFCDGEGSIIVLDPAMNGDAG